MFDISKIINEQFNRKVWKMDTSHFSILQKFLLNSNERSIRLVEVGDNRFQFMNPSIVKRDNDPGFSAGAIGQYIRILVFYGVIDFNKIINLQCTSWRCVMDKMIEGQIYFEDFSKDPENYLLDNFVRIVESIKEQVNSSNKMIRDNAIVILSTMETFLNFKNSQYSKELKVENFNTFLRNYEYEIDAMRPDGSDDGYIDELNNWMKMYDYCEELMASLLSDSKDISISESAFGQMDFTGYGYVGEYLFNEYMKSLNKDVEWISIKDKYSPFDFKVEDDFVEVKTPTTKRKKISFNLSWNEYIQHQAKKEHYKIYYVDGVYNVDIKKIIRNGITDLQKLISDNEIVFKEIPYDEIRDYRFAPKGYWVTER